MSRFLCSALLILILGNASFAQVEKLPITLAVFEFQAKDRDLRDTAKMFGDLVSVGLSQDSAVRLVDRQDLQAVLEEQKLGVAGITDQAAPQIGRMLGAQAMLMGRLFEVNKELYVTVKLFSTETGEAFAEKSSGEFHQVDSISEDLAGKVASLLKENSKSFEPAVHLEEDQLETLRSFTAEGPTPRFFVYAREQTLGVPVIDPAVQTELQYLLLKVGLESVKDSSGRLSEWAEGYAAGGGLEAPPSVEGVDIAIIGEAFSEFATREKNLVSYRSRIELEAIDMKSGKVLAADRETHSAVDVSARIAAKSSLQEGSSKLAARLLPEALAAWRARDKPTP
jgi:TolB-like protein